MVQHDDLIGVLQLALRTISKLFACSTKRSLIQCWILARKHSSNIHTIHSMERIDLFTAFNHLLTTVSFDVCLFPALLQENRWSSGSYRQRTKVEYYAHKREHKVAQANSLYRIESCMRVPKLSFCFLIYISNLSGVFYDILKVVSFDSY